jgi:hypothetical protein
VLSECVQAYLPLEGPQLAEFEALLLTERFKEARMLGVTSFEKGLAQGLEQGLEKGREQGLEQGQRNLLLIMLEGRFGPLGVEAKQRFDALPREQLPAFGRSILRATSLADLGLEPAQPN